MLSVALERAQELPLVKSAAAEQVQYRYVESVRTQSLSLVWSVSAEHGQWHVGSVRAESLSWVWSVSAEHGQCWHVESAMRAQSLSLVWSESVSAEYRQCHAE